MEERTVIITSDGAVRFVYDDALADLLSAGEATLQRASHVEPAGQMPDGRGVWYADMVGGPLLGPFALRGEALASERAWLEERL